MLKDGVSQEGKSGKRGMFLPSVLCPQEGERALRAAGFHVSLSHFIPLHGFLTLNSEHC